MKEVELNNIELDEKYLPFLIKKDTGESIVYVLGFQNEKLSLKFADGLVGQFEMSTDKETSSIFLKYKGYLTVDPVTGKILKFIYDDAIVEKKASTSRKGNNKQRPNW